MLIVTPHWFHVPIATAALKAGLHVLVEKPVAVHREDVEKLIAAHTDKSLVLAAMFNQRTNPAYIAVRDIVQNGTLGKLQRINWTVTDWFRSNAYYASGSWRATWQGEGGGILLNQCPHNLDLLYWIFGQPKSVRAFCQFGQFHPIEVEDNVTAFLEFEGGATGLFVASTGEAPGVNRLEIAGDNGLLTMEGGVIRFRENAVATAEWNATTAEGFKKPENTERIIELPPAEDGGDWRDEHVRIMRNFVAAIRGDAPLIAPAEQGIHSVELANAMLLSTWENRTVSLPMDAAVYTAALQAKIDASPKSKKS